MRFLDVLRRFDLSCKRNKKGHLHHLMQVAFMEAAGFEPASRDIATVASTCVVEHLVFAHLDSDRQDSECSIRQLV